MAKKKTLEEQYGVKADKIMRAIGAVDDAAVELASNTVDTYDSQVQKNAAKVGKALAKLEALLG